MSQSDARFCHLVITPFNLPSSHSSDRAGNRVGDEAWMAHRMELFRAFTFPAMQAQSCQNFIWLVRFREESRHTHADVIAEWSRFPNFRAIYGSAIFDDIKQIVPPDCRYLITTRIDNDDAFHCRAVERIQQEFSQQEFSFINFKLGYCLREGLATRTESMSSPFLSLVERYEPTTLQTVLCAQHGEVIKRYPVVQIADDRYWLQVIHQRNIANDFNGNLCSVTELNAGFGIPGVHVVLRELQDQYDRAAAAAASGDMTGYLEQLWQLALRLPDDPHTIHALRTVLQSAGNRAYAIRLFANLLTQAPLNPLLHEALTALIAADDGAPSAEAFRRP
ncbi:MAG: hypothetical protein KDD44_03465 [Bdellovibrionales bacterium]|nr:hypothetical protein [Bdellovibrionales bacterium]